jgi:hypothetical protein
VLIRMGVDTISAAEFMQLIQDEAAAKGLSDKRDYNSFLVMPDRADKLASLVFRIASGTQVCYQGCPMRLTCQVGNGMLDIDQAASVIPALLAACALAEDLSAELPTGNSMHVVLQLHSLLVILLPSPTGACPDGHMSQNNQPH